MRRKVIRDPSPVREGSGWAVGIDDGWRGLRYAVAVSAPRMRGIAMLSPATARAIAEKLIEAADEIEVAHA